MIHRSGLMSASLVWVVCAAACGSDPATGVPETALAMTVVATGLDVDTQYSLTIAGLFVEAGLGETAESADSTTVTVPVVFGLYDVELTNVAANCTVGGTNPRPVDVVRGQLTAVRFTVVCGASTGVVAVTALTSGPDPDPDGYLLSFNNILPLRRIASSGDTIVFPALPANTYFLSFFDIAPHCSEPPGNPRSVTVSAGGTTRDTVRVTLRVNCEARGRIVVGTTTTGPDVDANGYLVTLRSNYPWRTSPVPASGVTAIDGVAAGTYAVVLSGLTPNCNPVGPSDLSVGVVSGDSTSVAFSVTCTVASELALERNGEIHTVRSNGGELTRLTTSGSSPAWSPDGSRIAFISTRTGDPGVYVMNADGSGVALLQLIQVTGHRPAWSPDGTRIAFADDSDGDGRTELHVMATDGTGVTMLVAGAASDRSPAWSPDGSRIAFSSFRDGTGSIYVANADGSGTTRITEGDQDDHPAWSPDGTRIAFVRTSCDYYGYSCSWRSLQVVNADGSGLSALLDYHIYADPSWSPDGAWIAFGVVSCDSYYGICSGEPAIGAVRPDGTDVREVVGAATRPAWRP